MMELLAPAGSQESVVAAIQNGADAVYLGCSGFNARRNAVNFTEEQMKEAVEYCHLRDAKVYLTLNTLLYDRELENAAALVRYADEVGVDAILAQDMGVIRMIRQTAPDMVIHASTQMTIHNLDGVKMAADLGIERAVLSRELSKDQIAYLCAHSPIELEAFVHGALCMCYSGQCFFSSVIGGRSGNRGLCAQPCRLKYGWNGKATSELLSLKDMGLVEYITELDDMGVACAKIEGRMKRPEYVAIVTGIYATVLREHRLPTAEEMDMLKAAYSRQGFTQGFYKGKTGPEMFGIHTDHEVDPTPMFKQAKVDYSRGERPRVPITVDAEIKKDTPVCITVGDSRGNRVCMEGDMPEIAVTRELTEADVEKQLRKTGGTPYIANVTCKVERGLSVPVSSLNGLRRNALEKLSELRIAPPIHTQNPWKLPERKRSTTVENGGYAVSVQRWDQISDALLDLRPARIEIPLELVKDGEKLRDVMARCPVYIVMPRIIWDKEEKKTAELLMIAKEIGVTHCLCATWDSMHLAQRLGFEVAGDFGLGVTNSETLRALRDLGLCSATLSFEQRLARLRDLSDEMPTELIVYGRLPLMIMENCIIANRNGGRCIKACQTGTNLLTDRKGAKFPVVRAYGCRNEILNSKVLYLADKRQDYRTLNCRTYRLFFTLESQKTCVSVLRQYLGLENAEMAEITRGLYYRDVE